MLAKKSIETGEGCDSIPESMRHYLAMQFDPTKPGARDPFGRAAGFGAGMYANEVNPSGKVGEYSRYLMIGTFLTVFSHLTLYLPLLDNWKLAPYWTKCNGSCGFLLARQGIDDLLHQQRFCRL